MSFRPKPSWLTPSSRRTTKFGNVPTEAPAPWGGTMRYASKGEAAAATRLADMQERGEIRSWLAQVSVPIGRGPRGYVRHVVDFAIVHNDGSLQLYEIKGHDLPAGRRKRRDLEAIVGMEVQVNGRVEPRGLA